MGGEHLFIQKEKYILIVPHNYKTMNYIAGKGLFVSQDIFHSNSKLNVVKADDMTALFAKVLSRLLLFTKLEDISIKCFQS